MDNASNCDKAAEQLAVLNPHWDEQWRVRCILHIVNLMAQVRHDMR